jgi:hypothetical protein
VIWVPAGKWVKVEVTASVGDEGLGGRGSSGGCNTGYEHLRVKGERSWMIQMQTLHCCCRGTQVLILLNSKDAKRHLMLL